MDQDTENEKQINEELFAKLMLGDSVVTMNKEDNIEVKEVAELVAEAI